MEEKIGGEADRHACRKAHGKQRGSLAQDHAEDVVGLGAERHAHADVSGALSGELRDHAIQADRGYQEAHECERADVGDDEIEICHVLLDLGPEGTRLGHGQVSIERGHDLADPGESASGAMDVRSTMARLCCASFFDYKTGSLSGITQVKMHSYQWLGLIISALSAGLVFWLLFTYLKIGSPELFAQRAQAKAAIIQTFKFDKYIIAVGFLFAFVLKKLKISPAMTFGGILMPNDMTFALITGGVISHFTKHKNNNSLKDFFCAGVFSSESIWVFIKIIFKIFI